MRLNRLASALLLATTAAVTVGPRSPVAAEAECVVIDDFSAAKVGEFPAGWKVRKDEGAKVYTVREENGQRHLRAHSEGLGIQAAREHQWNLNEFPVLAWSWRAVEFPKGPDERESGRNDSVVSVYMLVPYSKVRGPKAVKYVWSERVPVGTHLTSNGGLTQVRVLKSGTEGRGRWVDERVNVRDDFLKFFGTKKVPKPAGIAVLTDSDDTASTATGDYANFRVCRR
jgi:DUF3047 family protein